MKGTRLHSQLLVGQTQTRHLGVRPNLRGILHPVVDPALTDFASLILEVKSVPTADLSLVRRLLDWTNRVAAETSDGFDNLLAGCRIAISPARGQLLRFRLRPEILGNGVDLGGIPLVPIRPPAVIRVPPELGHACLRFRLEEHTSELQSRG